MTFPAGKVTTGLIDGKVVLRARQMDSMDEPARTGVSLLECKITGKTLPLLCLNKTTTLRITLLD